MKVYLTEKARVTKEVENSKEYYLITQYIKLENVYDFLPEASTYVLGHKIAYSNALALLRVIKQTTKYSTILKVYTTQVFKKPDKIVIEVHAEHFPKVTIYLNSHEVHVKYHKTLKNKAEKLSAFVPVERNRNYKRKKRK